MNPDEILDRIDRWQQGHAVLALPVGVYLRYREDRGYEYAALLSYYGFFSLFPLLVVLITALDFLLRDNAELKQQVLDTVLARIPVVGSQLESVESLEGTGVALVVAIGFTLWAGLGVVKVAQDAFNTMWGVQIMRRPGFFPKLLRSLAALAVIGAGFVVATVFSAAVSFFFDLPGAVRVVGAVLAMGVNFVVVLVMFRVLTASSVPFRAFIPGAVAGAVGLWILQTVGGIYIGGVVAGASALYGGFAAVVGLLMWLALLARVLLNASEVNVVASKHLWARSFTGRQLTEADERSFAEVSNRDIRRPGESG